MDCLVTKLKGNVSDDSLLKLGEFRIKVYSVEEPSVETQGMTLQFTEDTEVKIIGDGYFTDESLTANLGTSKVIPANTATSFYLSNGDYEISIANKYGLAILYLYYQGIANVGSEQMGHFGFNFNDLKYSTKIININAMSSLIYGDIETVTNFTSLNSIILASANLSGDLKSFVNSKNIINLNLSGVKGSVKGDISVFKDFTNLSSLILSPLSDVYGDVSELANCTKLVDLNLEKTGVHGNISAFSNLTNLVRLRVLNMTGSLDSLSKLNKLQFLSIKKSALTGDLAGIPSTCYFASFQTDNGSLLTWSARLSTANIIAIEGNPKIDNVDKMLQDQAQCVKAIPSSGEAYYKAITATGTRTSASDAAVATLQEKGYTVTITNE